MDICGKISRGFFFQEIRKKMIKNLRNGHFKGISGEIEKKS